MNPHYAAVAARARRRCEYCRAPELLFNFHFEVDHIIPKSKGGLSILSNLALACRSCNLFKSDRITVPDSQSHIEFDLFHPRMDVWFEHFQFDTESGQLVGITPKGIATINLLKMNDPVPLTSRIFGPN